jgi:hypothetical protein
MSASRRNVLTILGLAPLATPAIASCDITRQDFDGDPIPLRIARYDPERLAVALERLAKEVRDNTVNVARFHIGSEAVDTVGKEQWLTQTLTIDLEILHPEKPTA